MRKRRVDGSISPQLRALYKTFTCIYNKACVTNASISFIEIIGVIEGILKGPTTTKKRQKNATVHQKNEFVRFLWIFSDSPDFLFVF